MLSHSIFAYQKRWTSVVAQRLRFIRKVTRERLTSTTAGVATKCSRKALRVAVYHDVALLKKQVHRIL